MAQVVTPIEVFCSYAHEDEALQKKLKKQLSTLIRQGLITLWHDRQITPGSLWTDEIDAHLKSAQIILLLISSDFIDSEYCYSVEMEQALARHEAGDARVIPIILRSVDLKGTPFEKLQALPKNAKPVVTWTRRDDAFVSVVEGIRAVVEELNGTKASSSQQYLSSSSNNSTMLKKEKTVGDVGNQAMESAALIKLTPKLKIAITHYYDQLEEFQGIAEYELAVRSAFQNLLAEFARSKNWTLLPEQTLQGNIRPDGTLRDNAYELTRGYWEAKGPKSDLDKEIAKKIADGYPLTNIIFENTKRAVLYQNKKRAGEFDLTNRNDLIDLLRQFFSYTEPVFASFEVAVKEFKERVPELAQKLLVIIKQEHKLNKRFVDAFNSFAGICRISLNPNLSDDAIDEMLVQHLLTVRLFRTVFNNSDFTNRNVIASEIEKVIKALTSRAYSLDSFVQPLDRFYIAIEAAAKGLDGWTARQQFLSTVYERFFQGFSKKQADTYGIVYTPQQIVDFMCASVDEVLRQEFNTTVSEPNVRILDPATGTGSFVVNLLHRIPRPKLKHKYLHDLFCNEIMLLPYYIASLNIEHEFYERMGEYEQFEGICFTDTLELAAGQQPSLFVEENTVRVQREKDAQIMVVIGNPPYNVGQVKEDDNNKNRRYPILEKEIKDTYIKDSKATLHTKLHDAYVKFFRWSIDRLQGNEGIVCLVTNNSFVDQTAFDGMRKHLLKDFTRVYHLDLHGNVRKNPKLSGTTHNVFGIKVGVGITIAIKSSKHISPELYYYRVPENWRRTDKLAFLKEKGSVSNIEWQELKPDTKYNWITEKLRPEFDTFLPMGTKETKNARYGEAETIFKTYGLGVNTARDSIVYDFDVQVLLQRVKKFIEDYNGEVFKWIQAGRPSNIDSFVRTENVKWSEHLKNQLQRGRYGQIDSANLRRSAYRPFCKQWLYYDSLLIDRPSSFNRMFNGTGENISICLTDLGSEKPFMTLAANVINDLHLVGSGCGTETFPYYIYSEDGLNRRENITDWSLSQFQENYGTQVTKWDIFHFVYSMLHHPVYRQYYAENLKRDLPHIPLPKDREMFETCIRIGKHLMDLHVNYEQAKEYNLTWVENQAKPFSWRVEKMRISSGNSEVVINESLTLAGIPQECFEYRLGNRSALEWIIDQYQVEKDIDGNIVSDPNSLDDEEYIVRLVGKVVTVSVETVRLVNELAQAVTKEDWLDEREGIEEQEE